MKLLRLIGVTHRRVLPPLLHSLMLSRICICTLALAPSLLLQITNARAAEIWDSTTLDVRGEQKLLNGKWDYVAWGNLDSVPDFSNAKTVKIPGAQTEGAFRTRFSATASPEGKRIILHFGAVAFQSAVFVNGVKAGEHIGGMTPFELDVTELAREGENELVVLVLGTKGRTLSKESTGTAQVTFNERSQAEASNEGDKTILGGGMYPGDGIRQDVTVREAPLLRVADATLISSFRRKELRTRIEIQNQTATDRTVRLQLDVLPYDIASKTIGTTPVWTKVERYLARRGLTTGEIVQPWRDPQLWMPGDPHLYVARIRVLDDAGGILHERNVRFGFREVWLEGRKIIINGKPFRAFTHGSMDAEASPETTRAMFCQVMGVGINVVRPHTRPPVPSIVQIADEMGVGIIGESELCFNSNNAYEEPVFWSNFEQVYRERIARDKNHPSILIWSLANEVIITSPGKKIGQKFYEAFLRLRQADPTRPFMQEGDGDLRDMLPDAKGYPIDIINLHPYDISPRKNPLWSTEFPQVAWAIENAKTPQDLPATNKFGRELPDRTRPWFMGEFGIAQLAYPDFVSFWTGPQAFRNLLGGAEELIRSVGEITTIQVHAFRDQDMAGMDPWDLPDKESAAPYLKRALEPVTVFTRDYFAHWTAGEVARRHLVTLNDSFEKQSLKLTIIVKQGDKEISRKSEAFILDPGCRKDTQWENTTPRLARKTPLQFQVELANGAGQIVSQFQQEWSVYPEIPASPDWNSNKVWISGDESNFGNLAKWAGVRLRPTSDIARADRLRPSLIILDQGAANSLDQKARAALDAYVAGGGVLMFSGDDKPFGMDDALVSNSDSNSTRLFLLRESPLTAGMTAADWEFWRPDYIVSRANYPMSFDPTFDYPLVGGGRNGPMYMPLAVRKVGKGAIVASRLQLNQALPAEPAAKVFLNNLISYATTLPTAPAPIASELIFQCPPEEREAWKLKFANLRIQAQSREGQNPVPGRHIIFVSGKSTVPDGELDQMTKFLEGGGTVWVHRLSPETPFLERVSQWMERPIALRAPAMWLPQMELVSPASPPPLLNGLNDFLTCWASFSWTNGNMNSVESTPIVDYVLEPTAPAGEALLKEPDWTGQWEFGPTSYLVSQAILREAGTHPRNISPGLGLVTYPVGKGRLIVDQLRWDEVMDDPASESRDKARYVAGNMWKNLGSR